MKTNQPFQIIAEKKNLGKIRRYIEKKLTINKVSNQLDRENILLAAMEAVTNICVHGYQGQKGVLEVEVAVKKDSIRVYLRDQAPIFNPNTINPPDFSIPLEDRPMGGMGIYLMDQLMDRIIHKALPGGGNELVLVKKIDHKET